MGIVADERTDKQIEQAREQLQRLAREQAVKPFDFDVFLSVAPIGPKDKTADEMIQAIYQGDETTATGTFLDWNWRAPL